MLSTPSRSRPHVVIVACALLVAWGLDDAPAGDRSGIEALAARTPTIGLQARARAFGDAAAFKADPRGCDATFPASRCFDLEGTLRGMRVNVGSFFDRSRPPGGGRTYTQPPRSSSAHYFIKYYEPAALDSQQVHGFSFWSRASSIHGAQFPAVGVITTSAATPRFPTNEQLRNLQRLNVETTLGGAETCIDLTSERIHLRRGEAAWMVLNFPDVSDSVFAGIAADTVGTDQACDFMTPNAGQVWYRPDPRDRPRFDWAITVYTEALTSKGTPTWADVKQVYR